VAGPELISQYKEDDMNQEQFAGHWENLKDSLKEKWDKITDEDLLQIDGDMLNFQKVLAARYGEEKEAVSTWANRRYSHISGNYDGYKFGLKDPVLYPG